MEVIIEKKCPSCKSKHNETTKCCASCIVKSRARYLLKKEEILQKAKEDRIENPEKHKQQNKKNYEKHKEERQRKNKEYQQEHKDEINERRRDKRVDNPEEAREKSQAYSNSLTGKCRNIISGAKQRQIIVDITKDEIMNITNLPCFYCRTETIDKVKRNGIDRMNNSKGYTQDNSVSCCWLCNNMKKCLDALTFVERCAQISYEHGGPGQTTEKWNNVNGMTFARYKSKITRKGKHRFELTYEQYNFIRNQSCFYCHRKTTERHMNGIDRKNSNIGYIFENCVSCCGDCNVAKGTNLPYDFIEQCKKISTYKHEIPNIPYQPLMFGQFTS